LQTLTAGATVIMADMGKKFGVACAVLYLSLACFMSLGSKFSKYTK